MSNSKAALGFLAGIAAGAILGLLFAPEKGSDLRKKISKKTGDWGDNLKNSFNDFVDGVKQTYSSAKDEAEDLAEKGKAKMNTYKNETKNTMA